MIGTTIAGTMPATSYAQPYSQGETQRVCRSNATAGAVIGGGLGGVLGNKLAGPRNREAGTAIGVLLGAVGGVAIAKAAMSNCERAVARDAAIHTARTGQTTQRVAPDNQRVVTASLAAEQSSGSQVCRTVEYALADDSSPPEQVEVCEVSPGDWRAMG